MKNKNILIADDDKIMAVDAVSCITKPFEPQDLLAKIKKALGEGC